MGGTKEVNNANIESQGNAIKNSIGCKGSKRLMHS